MIYIQLQLIMILLNYYNTDLRYLTICTHFIQTHLNIKLYNLRVCCI